MLSLRYNPLIIGRGGISLGNSLGSGSELDSDRKRGEDVVTRRGLLKNDKQVEWMEAGTDAVFTQVITMCSSKDGGSGSRNPVKDDGGAALLEGLSINDVFSLIDQHKLYLAFLTANEMITDDKKKEIFQKIDDVSNIIYLCTGCERSSGGCEQNHGRATSHASSVS